MKFSHRTNWQLEQNLITQDIKRLKSEGIKILDLSASNPSACGFKNFDESQLSSLLNKKNLLYNPHPRGMAEARDIIREYYAQRGVALSIDQIILTASTSEAYSFLFRLLGNSGDSVLFPRPSYPLFHFLTDLNDLHRIMYPLKFNGSRWLLDITTMDHLIEENTKAVLFVSPNNPTGSILTALDRESLNQLLKAHQLPLICDEVFLDYLFEDYAGYPTMASNKDTLTFVLGGLSKSLALPQMKLAWIIVNGPDQDVKEAVGRLEIIADTYLSVNTPAQNALKDWMMVSDRIQGEVLSRVKKNYQVLKHSCENKGWGKVLPVEGGWYAVIKLREGLEEETFVRRLLNEQYVSVQPGYFFDFEEDGFIIVSLLPETNDFDEGIKRISKVS